MEEPTTYTAFSGYHRVAEGDLGAVVLACKHFAEAGHGEPVLVFDDRTGAQLDFDLSGSDGEALERLATHPHMTGRPLAATAPRGRGRPKLGVVAREVTLLPRHWDWLAAQPGGASGALRRLVDEARKADTTKKRARQATDALGSFLWAVAGDLPGLEEATRALYRGQHGELLDLAREWPNDVRAYVSRSVEAIARTAGA